MVHAKPITQHANWKKKNSYLPQNAGGKVGEEVPAFIFPLKIAMLGGGN